MDIASFKTDLKKEVEGVWEELPNGARLKIARLYNDKMVEAYRKYPASIRRAMDKGQFDEEESRKVMAHLYARFILLDWEGISENGAPLPYSIETAERLLADEENKNFRALVHDIASDEAIYHKEVIEEKAKNSASD